MRWCGGKPGRIAVAKHLELCNKKLVLKIDEDVDALNRELKIIESLVHKDSCAVGFVCTLELSKLCTEETCLRRSCLVLEVFESLFINYFSKR